LINSLFFSVFAAAIPAVIAYNRYATDITRILNRYDSFQEEFSNILFRISVAVCAWEKTTGTAKRTASKTTILNSFL